MAADKSSPSNGISRRQFVGRTHDRGSHRSGRGIAALRGAGDGRPGDNPGSPRDRSSVRPPDAVFNPDYRRADRPVRPPAHGTITTGTRGMSDRERAVRRTGMAARRQHARHAVEPHRHVHVQRRLGGFEGPSERRWRRHRPRPHRSRRDRLRSGDRPAPLSLYEAQAAHRWRRASTSRSSPTWTPTSSRSR